MRTTLQAALSCTILALCAHVQAIDWAAAKVQSAQIEVLNMKPISLAGGGTDRMNWLKVPAQFTKYGAVVYTPEGAGTAVADITVNSDGYLFIACDYDYEGNGEGGWKKEVWDEAKFKAKGWHVMTKAEMDGDLLLGDDRKVTVFMKVVHKGDTFRLRCNKRRPPFPIILSGKK